MPYLELWCALVGKAMRPVTRSSQTLVLKRASTSTPPNALSDSKYAHSMVTMEAMEVKGECSQDLRESPLKVWKDIVLGENMGFFHNDVADAQRISFLCSRCCDFHASRVLLTCVYDRLRCSDAPCRVRRSFSNSFVSHPRGAGSNEILASWPRRVHTQGQSSRDFRGTSADSCRVRSYP